MMDCIFRTVLYPFELVLQIFSLTHCRSVLLDYKLFNVARAVRKNPTFNMFSRTTAELKETYNKCDCDFACKTITAKKMQCIVNIEMLITNPARTYCHCGACRVSLSFNRFFYSRKDYRGLISAVVQLSAIPLVL